MALVDIVSLLTFVLIATISPGGATALATASGASLGYVRSLPLMAGIAGGLGTMAAGAALGLSGVLTRFPELQILMRAAGTAYLLWLAFRLMRQQPSTPGSQPLRPRGIWAGVWLVWHNPKGWAMTTSASAAYVGFASGPIDLALILGLSFSVMAVLSLSVWCLAGRAIGRKLTTGLQWRVLNGTLAAMLVLSIIPLWLE